MLSMKKAKVVTRVTITGVCTVKKAARFYAPENGQNENIAVTKELK